MVDEVPWLLHDLDLRGARYADDEETIETVIVGDLIGFSRIGARHESPARE